MPEAEREKAGAFSKCERQKLQTLHTQGGGGYVCVRNLVNASNLSAPKVRQILNSRLSYSKFALVTCKSKTMIRKKLVHGSSIWC